MASPVRTLMVAALVAGLGTVAEPAYAQQSVSVGQTVRGSLAQGDSQLSSGEFADTYSFQGRAGETVTVRMLSDNFDTYVGIRGPGDFQQDNDDEATPATNAGLTLTLPRDGAYRILATSFAAGQTGAYTLQLTSGGNTPQSAASSGGAIQIGQTVNAALANGDQQLSSGEFADSFTVSGRRGQTLVIDVASSAFDTYLIVGAPGVEQADNDDNGDRGSTDSRVTITLAQDGEVRIRPTSYRPGETGAYTLSVQEQGAAATQTAIASSGAVRIGQSLSGALQNGDGLADAGQLRDVYTLNGRRGQQIEVALQSDAFDPYVAIFGPDDFNDFNDDDAENGTLNSRLLVTLPADGAYTILATSYAAGQQGAYNLSIAESDAIAPGQGSASGADVLRPGRTANGSLAQGDETLRSGEFTDTYRFSGEAGQRVRIDMSSSAFDSYVILVSPSGAQEDNDDGPGGVGDSVLETELAESGEYAIIATSYAAAQTGDYTLRVSAGASSPVASAGRPSGANGRVFAVMVGISDYQGFANNLSYTDEDAVKMAEALRRAGVLAEQSVVLTNAQATRAGVQAAFQRVAAQAGPNDTFLFFYSGHGTQTPAATGGTEPDGRDESIVMVDGLISDDDMAQMFRQVRAGTSIIALDSCFSGGFARDVVAVPGVMGLFSSEEDLTSAVADKFQAGGYLSLFLRNALAGEADANHDRALTAGELSVYLRREFAQNAQDVDSSTMEGARNYQFLVVDRGGVGVDDLVLRTRG
ncbi:MAG: caspase family protein [Terricaulis sp.]